MRTRTDHVQGFYPRDAMLARVIIVYRGRRYENNDIFLKLRCM